MARFASGKEITSAQAAGFKARAQKAGMNITVTTPLSAVANWARGNMNKGGAIGRTATSLNRALGGSQ